MLRTLDIKYALKYYLKASQYNIIYLPHAEQHAIEY